MTTKNKTRIEAALELLNQGELKYGSFIPAEHFEEVFGFKRDSQEFNWLVYNIRQALYEKGMYLSGEEFSQTGGYSILPPEENRWVAKLAMERAERDLAGKEILLVNTPTDGFTELQKARHESTLRILSLRLAAIRNVQEHNEKVARRRKAVVEEPVSEKTEE